jgi:hypothetical protein
MVDVIMAWAANTQYVFFFRRPAVGISLNVMSVKKGAHCAGFGR